MLKRTLVVVLLLSSSLVAQSQSHKTYNDLDGSDWQQFTDVARGAYVAGYVSAMFQAEGFALVCETAAMTAKVTAESPAADLARICIAERKEFHFAEVAGVSQYRQGIDAFYKDFRNLQVPLPKAIGFVRDQINGRPAEDIEKELVAWRQCHADATKCVTPASSNAPAPNPAKTPPR